MEKLTKDEIQQILIEVIAKEMDIPTSEILPDMSLLEDLGITSLDAMNVIMELEDRFEKETEIEEVLERTHVYQLVDYLDELLNQE